MRMFEKTVVTNVYPPFFVTFERGRRQRTENRPCFGLSFCESGQLTYTQNGQTIVEEPSCAVLLPKGATYTLHGDCDGMFPVVNFECEGLDVQTITAIRLSDVRPYIRDMKALAARCAQGDGPPATFRLIYGMFERLCAEQTRDPLTAIVGYIERHLSDTALCNTVLAEKMQVSEVYVRKLFLKYRGMTPKQFILERRIGAAKVQLCATADSVTAVAEACGFSSVYHFCRIFKEKTGLTPTDYAKRYRAFEV